MNSGILERIRQLHTDIEQHRTEIAYQRAVPIKNPRHQMLADHFVLRKALQIKEKADALLDLYDDEDFERAVAATVTVAAAVKEFDEQTATAARYNQAHPQPPHVSGAREEVGVDDEAQYVRFTGSERHGRCLDLQEHYARFVAFLHVTASYDAAKPTAGGPSSLLKVIDAVTPYPDFVRDLVRLLQRTPARRKLADVKAYDAFVSSLAQYVHGFHDRVRPLQREETARMKADVKDVVRAQFGAPSAPAVVGWEHASLGGSLTPEQRTAAIAMAEAEVFVERLIALLPLQVEATLSFHERKFTKTAEELTLEEEEDDATFRHEFAEANRQSILANEGSASAGVAAALVASTVLKDVGVTTDDMNRAILERRGDGTGGENPDDAKFANKKNFPLDADGKPIPVWLYHLHGLHLPYYCEICSYTYHGERAYTMHFQEPRHAKGLERLGIDVLLPQLHLVSRREEALTLFTQVQRAALRKRARAEDEEIENIDGMVMTREQLQSLHRTAPTPGPVVGFR